MAIEQQQGGARAPRVESSAEFDRYRSRRARSDLRGDDLTEEGPAPDGAAELIGRVLGGGPIAAPGDLGRLSRATAAELEQTLGVSPEGARRIEACFRLGRTVEISRRPMRDSMVSPEAVAAAIRADVRGLDRETFHGLYLDARHRLLECRCVSVGTLTASLVHPREVLGPAVRLAAAAFVVAHNHPSGDPEPSAEDRRVTTRLAEAGELLGIPLIDHVVVGDPGFVSLRRRGFLKAPD